MYCTHCGNQIPDQSKFCRYCGSRLSTPAEPQVQVSPPPARKKGRTAGIIIGIVAVLILVPAVLFAVLHFRSDGTGRKDRDRRETVSESITAADLTGRTIMVYPDFPYRQLLETAVRDCKVVYEEPLRLVAAAANNDALAIFPPSQDVLLHEYVSGGTIIEKEIADLPIPMEVNLIYSDYFSRTDAGKLMIRAVRDYFSKEDPV